MDLDRCSDSSGWVVADSDEASGHNTVQCFVEFDEAINFIRERIIANNCDHDEYQGKCWELYCVQSGMVRLAGFWNNTANLPDLMRTEQELWDLREIKMDEETSNRESAIDSVDFLRLDKMSSDQRCQMQQLAWFVLGDRRMIDDSDLLSKLYPISSDIISKVQALLLSQRTTIEPVDLKRLLNWLQSIK